MADTDTAKDIVASMDTALGRDISKSRSIKTNLPSDNLGFWLTQGVPTGLIFAHLLMQIVGESDVGICFVPTAGDNKLDQFQIQYITQFCLNQASDYDCFNANGSLTDECKFSSLCNINSTAPTSVTNINFFDSLFVYRNYVWFLFIFAFVRGVPQILWSLYFTAEIAVAIEAITIFAESLHSGDNLKKKKLERLHKAKAFKKRNLFWFYVARKITEILLDITVITLILMFFGLYNTPFHKLVFVCDLHRDRDNIFLCDIMKQRFISCTVSFEFEFIMTLGLQLGVLTFDLVFQASFLIYLFRKTCSPCASLLTRWKSIKGETNNPESLLGGTSEEDFLNGEYNKTNSQGGESSKLKSQEDEAKKTMFNVTNMYSLKDLHLICMLQKQNKSSDDHFLKMVMVEKMIDELEKSNKANTGIPSSAAHERDQGGKLGPKSEPEGQVSDTESPNNTNGKNNHDSKKSIPVAKSAVLENMA